MHIQDINTQLNQLMQEDWENICKGDSLIMQEDARLLLVSNAIENIFLDRSMMSVDSVEALRIQAIDQSDALLEHYYRKHPLTKVGFARKALVLVHGHEKDFAASPGQAPSYTLFVEGGEVVAEDQHSPKHPYGVYCELPAAMASEALSNTVQKWLESGDAHENYLEMNVCRYFC